jgi:site-specific DNA-methyltransferase (adenine-specific)
MNILTENYKLYLGDCLEVMDKLIEQGVVVDAIITDPPFGTTKCKWDSVIPFDEMWSRLNKLIKPNGAIVLFGSQPFTSNLIMSNVKKFKYEWVWEKSNPSNIGNVNRQPLKYHENICVFYEGQCTYNKQMIPRLSNRIEQAQKSDYVFHNSKSEQNKLDYIEVSSKKYDKDFKNPSTILKFNSLRPNSKEFVKHPTQKPVALMEYLIKTYTNENETVLDFTMGSGSTGVACLNTNRKFIGIELNENYFNISINRIFENYN